MYGCFVGGFRGLGGGRLEDWERLVLVVFEGWKEGGRKERGELSA